MRGGGNAKKGRLLQCGDRGWEVGRDGEESGQEESKFFLGWLNFVMGEKKLKGKEEKFWSPDWWG